MAWAIGGGGASADTALGGAPSRPRSALFDSMDVGDNVAFALRRLKMHPEGHIREVVEEKLSMVGLRDIQRLMPAELSGGMKKRVAIARALVMEPQLMLYDEPTSELDPVMSATISEIIASLRQEYHVTTIVVSHDRELALQVADRVGILMDGNLVYVGTV